MAKQPKPDSISTNRRVQGSWKTADSHNLYDSTMAHQPSSGCSFESDGTNSGSYPPSSRSFVNSKLGIDDSRNASTASQNRDADKGASRGSRNTSQRLRTMQPAHCPAPSPSSVSHDTHTLRNPDSCVRDMSTVSAHGQSMTDMLEKELGSVIESKRQRVSRACDRCRRKKVKCDGARPVCSHCQVIGSPCTYLDATKKRGPPKGYIEAIEGRLHRLEGLLVSLIRKDPKAAHNILEIMQDSDNDSHTILSDPSNRVFGDVTVADLERGANRSEYTATCIQPNPTPDSAMKGSRYTAIPQGSISGPETVPAEGPSLVLQTNVNASETSILHNTIPSSTSVGRTTDTIDGYPRSSPYTGPGNPNGPNINSEGSDESDCADHLFKLERGVGHLTLDSTGALRYLGDSSGWYIINQNLVSSESSPRLTRSVDGAFRWPPITTIPTRISDLTDTSPGASINGGGGAGSKKQGIDLAKAPEQMCMVSVPRNLPPCGKPPMPDPEEASLLLKLYFRYVHPVLPILYKSHFLKRCMEADNPTSPALLSAVYAAASTYKAREAKTESDLTRVRIQMAVHFQRAKLYLDEQYTLNTLASILTLLLMSVYEQGTMSTRSWLYSGMAIRKAYDLGLHRDVGLSKHGGQSVVSPFESEMRLRAWWGCYIMDIMVSATLGRPTTIRDFTFDAPYPVGYGEDDDELLISSSLDENMPLFTSGQKQPPRDQAQAHKLPKKQPQSRFENTPAITVAARMRDYVSLAVGESDSDDSDKNDDDDDVVVFKRKRMRSKKPYGAYYLKLLHIFGHILTEMYACKPHRSYVSKFCLHDLHSRTECLIALDHELREWKASLPVELQYPIDDILAAQPARAVYIALIHLVYYTAMILLHRPFIPRLGDPHPSSSRDDTNPLSNGLDHPQDASSHGADRADADSESQGSSTSSPRPNTTSPLPSHAICTVSAQMISLIGQAIIQDSRIFIMPFLTFMMFTAGTLHLNNVIVAADSWIARRFLKRTLKVMSRLGAHWQVSYKCYTMLSTLVRANRIGLDQIVEDDQTGIRVMKERCKEIAKMANDVYENRSLYRERHSSSRLSSLRTEPPSSSLDRSSYGSSHRSNGSQQRSAPHSSQNGDYLYFASQQLDKMQRRTKDTQNIGSQPLDKESYSSTARTDSRRELRVHTSSNAINNISTHPNTNHSYTATANIVSRGPDTADVNTDQITAPFGIDHNEGVHGTMAAEPFSVNKAKRKRTNFPTIFSSQRYKLNKDGTPIVPASPYTSVDLTPSNELPSPKNIFSQVSQDGINTLTQSPQGRVVTTSDSSHITPSNIIYTPGQFVPSLEFFANADFPLGIGGPNGQTAAIASQLGIHNRDTSDKHPLYGLPNQKNNLVESNASTISTLVTDLANRTVMAPSKHVSSSMTSACIYDNPFTGNNLPIDAITSPSLVNSSPMLNTPIITSSTTTASDYITVGSGVIGVSNTSSRGVPISNILGTNQAGFNTSMSTNNTSLPALSLLNPAAYDFNLWSAENLNPINPSRNRVAQDVLNQSRNGYNDAPVDQMPAGRSTPPKSSIENDIIVVGSSSGNAEVAGNTSGRSANGTAWKDYVNQVIKMFNSDNLYG